SHPARGDRTRGRALFRHGRQTPAGSALRKVTGDFRLEGDGLVRMRDGVSLSIDVYRPARDGAALPGRFPVLLERTPYGKRRAVLNQAGEFFARRGYVVVIQDVRGRFDSEGDWYFLSEQEGPDGFDTMAWISSQSW